MRKSGGLDVEAVGGMEEVQKGFARAADWTLKRWKSRRKSKRSEKSGGLDVEAVEITEEVQKGFARAADWTLKRREAWRKSKRDSRERRIGR